jgi:hypothetical protein
MGSRLSRSFNVIAKKISLNIVPDIDIDWQLTGDKSPVEFIVNEMAFMEFSHEDSQEIITEVRIPSNYLNGKPIKLMNGSFFSNEIEGKVLFKCQTSIIRPETTIQGSFESEVEVGTEYEINPVQGRYTQIDEILLSDAEGKINGVAVKAKDILRIRFYREPENESVICDGSVFLMKESFTLRAS